MTQWNSELLHDFWLTITGGDTTMAEKLSQEHLRQLEAAEKARPTVFEEPAYYHVMMDLSRRLAATATAVLPKVPPIPIFGSLPLNEFNAMAIAVPASDERLIAFQAGVFGFATPLTQTVAASFPPTAENEDQIGFSSNLRTIEENWRQDDSSLRRLDELLVTYVVAGQPSAAERYLLGRPFSHLSSLMLDSFHLFLFAHELGHVFAGHLECKESRPRRLGATTVEAVPTNWAMEFEADRIGLTLTLRASEEKGIDPGLSYLGVDLFFSAIELISRAISTLTFGEPRSAPKSETHPPPAKRKEMLRKHLDRIGGQEPGKAWRFAARVEEVMGLMWDGVEPAMRKRYKEGIRPARNWA